MAEFAIVATLFLLFLFAIMEMGIVIYRYNSISMAAREAARYAVAHSSTSANKATISQIQQIAVNYAPFLTITNVNVNYQADTTAHIQNQNDVVVTITYNFTQQIPFLSAVPLTLSSSSQMLVSQ